MRKKISSLILGLAVIAVGVGYIGKGALGWEFDPFIKGWWAALLCFFFIITMINDKPNLFNIAGTIVFGMLFAKNYIPTLESVSLWAIIGGAIVVGIGVEIIRGAFRKSGSNTDRICATAESGIGSDPIKDEGDRISCQFGKSERKYDGETFSGENFSCSFGSFTIDLSSATITSGAKISLDCGFGEIKLILPNGITANVKSSAFLGSVNNSVGSAENADIYINAESSFGVINIIYG